MKPQILRYLAAGAVAGLALTGCAADDEQQPEAAPTDPETTPPASLEVDLEQFAAALVTDTALVGVAQDPPVEGFVDDPVTMYLTLSEFEPSGSCAELLDDLNAFSAHAVGGISAKFMRDVAEASPEPDAQTEAAVGASVETMIFETAELTEPMAIYREIPQACETLTSGEVEGAEATFTKVPGLDAIHLEISDGEDAESLAVGGSSVNARFHMYMTAEQVTLEETQEMFGAQAEKLQETFRDQVDSVASPVPAPTETPTPPETTQTETTPD